MKEDTVFTCSSVGGHGVCLRCLTWEIWRPRLRWTLQHSSQIRMPLFIEAQQGSEKQHVNYNTKGNMTLYVKHRIYNEELCSLTLALLLTHRMTLWILLTELCWDVGETPALGSPGQRGDLRKAPLFAVLPVEILSFVSTTVHWSYRLTEELTCHLVKSYKNITNNSTYLLFLHFCIIILFYNFHIK